MSVGGGFKEYEKGWSVSRREEGLRREEEGF